VRRRDFVGFFAGGALCLRKSGGQDLPVRQTLPRANVGPNSVKSLEKRGKMPSSI